MRDGYRKLVPSNCECDSYTSYVLRTLPSRCSELNPCPTALWAALDQGFPKVRQRHNVRIYYLLSTNVHINLHTLVCPARTGCPRADWGTGEESYGWMERVPPRSLYDMTPGGSGER
jgi:hypothetical protein